MPTSFLVFKSCLEYPAKKQQQPKEAFSRKLKKQDERIHE